MFNSVQKPVSPWWMRGQGIIFELGYELLTRIEFCQGLSQFHPNKTGGWIPVLVSCRSLVLNLSVMFLAT